MIKLLTIIGARPQIIKAAAISREIAENFSDKIKETILHTGQHYDENMSGLFFTELGIPEPDINLNVGSASHGKMTAKIISGVEEVLNEEHYDGVILYGDTNSTLAASVAASKLHVPIFHIEAGLRSYDMEIPEEVNRCVCDQLSSILFAPTQTAVDNLMKEGYCNSPMLMYGGRKRLVINSGDVMYDNSMYFSQIADKKSKLMEVLGLEPKNFILSTIHRNNNTDEPKRLNAIFRALLDISEIYNIKVVLPLHPRTRKLMPKNLSQELMDRLNDSKNIKVIEPASFFDIIELEKNAKVVVTDSGGVQKESFFFETPTVIMLHDTPWVEIVENNAGICVDADYDRIMEAYRVLSTQEVKFPKLFGDGHAANKILNEIIKYLNN